ncbi:MAG TPA: GGDEF domain-containing protein, partial [Burkholderiaceae bacterium]
MASIDKAGRESGTPIAPLLAATDLALAHEDVARARTLAGEVLRLTESRPDGLEHAHARLRLARCDFAVARIERAFASASQAAAIFRLHEERAAEVAALALAARAAARAGRVVEAVEAGLLAVALSESLPAQPAVAQAWCALGAAYGAAHHFASAERALRQAIELAHRSGDRATLADATIEATLAQLVRLALARIEGEGEADAEPESQPLLDALERCRELEVVGTAPTTTLARTLASAIALAACLSGDVDDARRHLALRGEPVRGGIAPHWSGALDAWTRLELAWHTHDAQGAVVHAAQIAAVADAAQHALLRGLGHLLAADLHESRGDVASALIEWKAGLRHDRANRMRDIDSRSSATGALLAARQHQLDVATLTAKAERFQQMAYEDSLTGIANLRRFEHCLVDALVAGADSGEPLCAAFIDCDRFKGVNDAFGHEVGDRALRAVAALLAHGVREGDVVARLGGDEFAILFRNAGLEAAREICGRIAAAVREHDWSALHPDLRLGVSIGVEQAVPGDTTRSLVARADKAMFEKKLQRDAALAVAAAPATATPSDALVARVAHWIANARQLVVFA